MYIPHPVHPKKTVLMQRLADAARHGYVNSVSGVIPVEKAPALFEKFERNYDTDRNGNQRAYAKRRGFCNTRLLAYLRPGDTEVHWWLVSTPGMGAFFEEETPICVTEKNQRLRVPGDYELVQLTRPKKHGGGRRWTWRMTKETFAFWNDRVVAAARSNNARRHREILHSLKAAPGYSGIRRQVGLIYARFRGAFRRHHGSLDTFPVLLKLGYVERMPDVVVSVYDLSDLSGRQ